MAEKDQSKPLAPAGYNLRSDEEEAMSRELKKLPPRKYIKCCGCITALILIQAVILLVLAFTIFRVKDPVIKMNGMRIGPLELEDSTNLTLVADVSVKNPNVASFIFSNATTSITYNGTMIGQARTPPGKAKARRTLRMNVTVEIIPEKIMAVTRLLSSRAINISSYTRIAGRVKIIKIIKKNVVVKLNCTMMVNLTSREIQGQSCKRHLWI
ncbi:late embryogenesis abundant protein At1g64065-like [Vitis riparia]|uniref:Late embryogenesis abundant protein n=2 Tax=Vitis vinifera TaxID=29760 RepID=A0A438E627_VITVI|nr:late embryogenesis abundant protein At1g64065-like [Vitis riparia]RVW43109.1 Late embryogenesis abundant protein [Vitis vinifera]